MDDKLRTSALELFKPPFHYHCGYIFDTSGNMVSDNCGETAATRLRGWGRIQYMGNPQELQDAVGELIAEALNSFWEVSTKEGHVCHACDGTGICD
jgi:hypothetical protein